MTETAAERAVGLLRPGRRPAEASAGAGPGGFLDLMDGSDATGALPGQRLMASRTLPLIYERAWRPLGGRLLMGLGGPDTAGERRIASELLALREGDRVLDVGCGPGNFTRAFARQAPGGLVVGVDASRTMLARAARSRGADRIAYVLADAGDLPFRDASFDAVCCFAALYLIERPLDALDEIARVLAPGGRVAILTSVNRGLLPAGLTDAFVRPLTGVRIFSREAIAERLRRRGLVVDRHEVTGLAQFLGAHRPSG